MKIKMHINAALICMGLVLAGIAQAATIPAKINYQGVLKDAAGVKVNDTVDIDLRLLPLGGGDAVFSESHTGVSVVGGLFSLKIGGVEDMSSVAFDSAYELELTVGGELLSPNTPLCSAPYALGVVGGAQGPQGMQGADGAAGAQGPTGAAGAQGPTGADGAAGAQGSAGAAGAQGPAGDSEWIPSEAANPLEGIWTAKAVGIGMGREYEVWGETEGDKVDLHIMADAGSGGYGTTADPAGVMRFILKDFDCTGGESLGQLQWYGNEANIAGGAGKPRASIDAQYVSSAGQTALYFNVAEVSEAETKERMIINHLGQIGMGVWPNHPLHMASGAIVTDGGVWTNASSRDMKENIAELTTEEAVEALTALTPVKYNYKKEQDEEYVGFIAEDVPALVATNNRKNLSPMDVVGVLTKVVQEQQLQMEAMKVELEKLKNLQN